MEFNQVRYFLTLANTLNFTRAAESCNVTQPALTRAIQKLEEELGGLLFYRERNLTQLTELGQLMRPLLEQTSAAAQAAREQAQAFKRRESAPLRLGLDYSVSASVLTPVLGELAARIKGFELIMRQYSSPEIGRLLLEGSIDAGLVAARDDIPDRLNRWELYEERLVVLCPPTHALSGLDEVPVARLAQERILRREIPDCAVTRVLAPLCAAAGIELQLQHSGSQEDSSPRNGQGLARRRAGGRASTRSARGWSPGRSPAAEAARPVVLAAVAGRQHGPSVASFLKLMRARDWSAEDSAGHGNDNPRRSGDRVPSATK